MFNDNGIILRITWAPKKHLGSFHTRPVFLDQDKFNNLFKARKLSFHKDLSFEREIFI